MCLLYIAISCFNILQCPARHWFRILELEPCLQKPWRPNEGEIQQASANMMAEPRVPMVAMTSSAELHIQYSNCGSVLGGDDGFNEYDMEEVFKACQVRETWPVSTKTTGYIYLTSQVYRARIESAVWLRPRNKTVHWLHYRALSLQPARPRRVKTAKKKWNFPCGARHFSTFSRRDMLSTRYFKDISRSPMVTQSSATCQGSWKLGIQQNVVTGDEAPRVAGNVLLVRTCDFSVATPPARIWLWSLRSLV